MLLRYQKQRVKRNSKLIFFESIRIAQNWKIEDDRYWSKKVEQYIKGLSKIENEVLILSRVIWLIFLKMSAK